MGLRLKPSTGINAMQAPDQSESTMKTVRRPLYGSVWLALFELLGAQWARLGNASIATTGDASPPAR